MVPEVVGDLVKSQNKASAASRFASICWMLPVATVLFSLEKLTCLDTEKPVAVV
jgi:hypothetical protein